MSRVAKGANKKMGTQDRSVQLKLSLLKLAGEIGSVSKACEMMDFSRDSYYRFKALYQRGGAEALKGINRKKPLLKNRVSTNVEIAVRDLALNHPGYGQQKASAALGARNITVSASGVRSIWIRHDLETKSKRTQAIRTMSLQDGLVLNPEQLATTRAVTRIDKSGLLEKGGPGYLCFHGLKQTRNIAGIGPVFLQIFQDLYSRYTFIRLSPDKNDPSATTFLDDHVFPWFKAENTPVHKIQSDRASAFCGQGCPNSYQSLLREHGIEHGFRTSRGKAPDEPGLNFHQLIEDEFFRFALPSRKSWQLPALQQAADEWLTFYNESRPNNFRFCYGKPPLKAFRDARTAILAAEPVALSPGLRRSSG